MCVWDIPAPIELVLHQHYLARKVFGEMFHTTFLCLMILLDLV